MLGFEPATCGFGDILSYPRGPLNCKKNIAYTGFPDRGLWLWNHLSYPLGHINCYTYKSKCYIITCLCRLFSDPSITRICAHIAMLPRFCSYALAFCQKFVHALAQLQKFVHVLVTIVYKFMRIE